MAGLNKRKRWFNKNGSISSNCFELEHKVFLLDKKFYWLSIDVKTGERNMILSGPDIEKKQTFFRFFKYWL